jgi:zinc protease
MNKLFFLLFFVLTLLFSGLNGLAGNITSYQLANGLTVILNEDHTQPSVFGAVLIKTGSKNDPSDVSGVSHYLEHMMFKGTQDMGTIDWNAEKPHYDAIIDLFEQLRATTDEVAKKDIYAKINQEAKAAGQFAIPNEFSNLVQGIGGTNLNAETGYDETQYFCLFPAFELRRWADLYSHLFQQPVFRGFQTEVETVFEEKNMYADDPFRSMIEEVNKTLFGNHPYSRPIIGTTENLKNPSLKQMIEYYQKWYVPSNMAVVLSGDFNPAEAKTILDENFGKWKTGTQPEVPARKIEPIKGKQEFKLKITPYKIGIWAFNGVEKGNENERALEIVASILSNSNQTGMLDKLQIDGDVASITASSEVMVEGGRFLIEAVPMFDKNQYRQLSVAETESIIFDEIDKLKKGQFDEWLLESVKQQLLQQYDLAFESPYFTASYLMDLFVQNKPVDEIYKIKESILKVDKAKVVALANQILNENHYTYQCLEGVPTSERVKKPNFDVVDLPKNAISEYKKHFAEIPSAKVEEKFIDFSKDITQTAFAPNVKLYYKNNSLNDIFTLTIRYGTGELEIPTLKYAVPLMNRAGVLVQYEPQQFKKELARMGCTLQFYSDNSYTYADLTGNEKNLAEACKMLSKVVLLPKLDQKQMDAILGGELMNRSFEKTDNDQLSAALQQFLVFGDNSEYLKRLPETELNALTIKGLTGDFLRATQYQTDIHYCGKMPVDQLIQTLKGNLAFAEGLKQTKSPVQRPLANYSNNTVYFLNNSSSKQSNIYFFINEGAYSTENDSKLKAFNQYFDGGFNGLVLQEIREYRAMAYTATGHLTTPAKPGLMQFFNGSIGTQADKTCNAVQTYVSLLKAMPSKPERMGDIKTWLVNSSLSAKPSPRSATQVIEYWETLGYTEDPAKVLIPKYRELTFDDVQQFYKNNIEGKPYAIAIVGDKKEIDLKKLEEFGKVVNLSTSKIFK